MITVVCYQCDAQFAIAHRSACPDQALAERQAIFFPLPLNIFEDLSKVLEKATGSTRPKAAAPP